MSKTGVTFRACPLALFQTALCSSALGKPEHASRVYMDQFMRHTLVRFTSHTPVVRIGAPCRQARRYKPGSSYITFVNTQDWERSKIHTN